MNKRFYHIAKNVSAALMIFEGVFLIIYAIINGLTLFTILDLCLGDAEMTLCDLSFLIGINRIIMAVYGATERKELQRKKDIVSFGIVLILSSLLGLISYVTIDTTLKSNIFWTVETILMCGLSALFLIGIKGSNTHGER